MNEKLSSLMDGELDREEARDAIRQLGANPQHRDQWDTYHMIGEVLRGDPVVMTESSEARRERTAAIFARLADEPTILAPAAAKANRPAVSVLPSINKRTRIALAMAASVATLSAIVVVAVKQQDTATVSNVRLVQQTSPQPVATPASNTPSQADVRVNDYLAIHRQFAGQAGFQNASARVVVPLAAPVDSSRERVRNP
jgi:sigma-E factor negative regulatory protein RseA